MENKTVSEAPRYRVYFTNHGYWSSQESATFNGAVGTAKAAGFEASIHQGGHLIATWGPIGGLRMVPDALSD